MFVVTAVIIECGAFVVVKPDFSDGEEYIVCAAYNAPKNAKYPLGNATLKTISGLALSGHGPKVCAVGSMLHNWSGLIGESKGLFHDTLKDVHGWTWQIFQFQHCWDCMKRRIAFLDESFEIEFPLKADFV